MMPLGAAGEEVAVKLLTAQGFRILQRNSISPVGEIDIVAARNHAVHFIEVKTRSNLAYGTPALAVTVAKQDRLRRVATYYMAGHSYRGDAQFGVVEVVYNPYVKRYTAKLIPEAF